MSLIYCEDCDGMVDTDYDEMKSEYQCMDCYLKEEQEPIEHTEQVELDNSGFID